MAYDDVERDILGDGTEGSPYRIEGIEGIEYEVISMNFETKKAVIKIWVEE